MKNIIENILVVTHWISEVILFATAFLVVVIFFKLKSGVSFHVDGESEKLNGSAKIVLGCQK